MGLLAPAGRPELLRALADAGITALALDAVPRISRAQSMDVLSSMANIAGYRAVVEAAHVFGRFFTGQVTAAGNVPPAKVLVAGAGVAGLAAIGAASSLGAVVRATDPRPEVADQVKSLGGEYLPVNVAQETSTDGYARTTSADYDRAAAELYHEQAQDVDIVITTALIPGRLAPRLLTARDVAVMKPGSVIVDMAAAQGGNVEGTVPERTVVTDNGVTIIGYTDLASRLPAQASQLFGTNPVNLLKLLTPGKDGRLVIDFADVVQRAETVVRDGDVTWPPPPVSVSAAPAAQPAAETATPEPERPKLTAAARLGLIGLGMLAMFLLVAFTPAQFARNRRTAPRVRGRTPGDDGRPLRAEVMVAAVAAHDHVLGRWLRDDSSGAVAELDEAIHKLLAPARLPGAPMNEEVCARVNPLGELAACCRVTDDTRRNDTQCAQ